MINRMLQDVQQSSRASGIPTRFIFIEKKKNRRGIPSGIIGILGLSRGLSLELSVSVGFSV
jgi:hypothetical protein